MHGTNTAAWRGGRKDATHHDPSGTGLLPPKPGLSRELLPPGTGVMRPLPLPLAGLSRPLPPGLSAVGLSGPVENRFLRARSRCQLSCLLQRQRGQSKGGL